MKNLILKEFCFIVLNPKIFSYFLLNVIYFPQFNEKNNNTSSLPPFLQGEKYYLIRRRDFQENIHPSLCLDFSSKYRWEFWQIQSSRRCDICNPVLKIDETFYEQAESALYIFVLKGQTTIKSAADKDEFMSVARTLDIILNLEDEVGK